MRYQPILALAVVTSLLSPASAQIGGSGTYAFLNQNPSARVAALSGSMIAVKDYDPAIGYVNPAMLNSQMHRRISASYINYFSDINNGQVTYAHSLDSVNTIAVSMLYMNYGTFDGYDENGISTGEFRAAEYNLQGGYSRKLNEHFTVGANAKLIYSALADYNSFGMAVDIAGAYFNDSKLFSATVLFSNIGTQFKPYSSGNYEPLPLNIQLALAKKLAKAPIRFTVLAHNLQTPDLSYTNTNSRDKTLDPNTGEIKYDPPSLGDKIFRHFTIGTELMFSPYFNIRVAYSHQRRQELKLTGDNAPRGLMGFSWGLGMKLGKFVLGYGATRFSVHKSANYFTVSTNFADYKKKKRPGQ